MAFEKVNPMHPDKIADRIAGAIVDLGYKKQDNPKIATEVLLGHGNCHIIIETSVSYTHNEIKKIVNRITKQDINVNLQIVEQDMHLANNQKDKIRCGDNGIFKGIPLTEEEKKLSKITRDIYAKYPYDGKYVLDGEKLIICQSNAKTKDLKNMYPNAIINPLGEWTGGIDVDTGCTNRKLGSDMGKSVTGGGLWGKCLSKADVSINVYAFLLAQQLGETVEISCAIGDEIIDSIYINGHRGNPVPYEEIVKIAKEYIDEIGGFEAFAEFGLV